METIVTIPEMQTCSDEYLKKGNIIGLVPTMGALHGGHLSLFKIARQRADIVVTSIFVNPLQFGPSEDFQRYPRDLEADTKKCEDCGVDIVFSPTEESLYGKDHSIFVSEEKLSQDLCGQTRPQFFRGVCTVVTKLFHIVQPHFAVFGQKDAQQTAVIRKLVKDLNWRIKIIQGSTVREEDGLAMSSRNAYLNTEQRVYARAIYQSLEKARDMAEQGVISIHRLRAEITYILSQQRDLRVIYVTIVNKDTMVPMEDTIEPGNTLIAVAVWCGQVRLIDNIIV